jgi:hypothetical protein
VGERDGAARVAGRRVGRACGCCGEGESEDRLGEPSRRRAAGGGESGRPFISYLGFPPIINSQHLPATLYQIS